MEASHHRRFILIVLMSGSVLLVLISYCDPKLNLTVYSFFKGNELDTLAFGSNGTHGCPMPNWDPFHPTVKKYYQKLKVPYRCNGKPSFLVVLSNATVQVDKAKLMKHHKLKVRDIYCTYEEIVRDGGNKKKPTDSKIYYSSTKKLFFGKPNGVDFVLVKCMKRGKKFHEEFLAMTPLRYEKEIVCEENLSKAKIKEKLNVVIVGIDSISRLNFVRHFNKTRAFLRDALKAVELKRYNKVADNTFPNLTPMLTGHFVKDYPINTFFDQIDLIWKHYADVGYRTLLAEDAPKIATYNYLKKGFAKPPTDFYLRPFSLAVEYSDIRRKSKAHCFADRMEMKVIFDYVRTFVDTMESRPHFSFSFVARLTHDKVNFAAYADDPSYDLLKHLHDSGASNKSLIVFMSDHGIRFGPIRETYIGKFEERWPIMHLAFPRWFLDKYPDVESSLKWNTDKLTTPFDVHKTLLDVLQVVTTGSYSQTTDSSTNGISLFQKIPAERTCDDAAILPHWCTCQMRVPVSVKTKDIRRAADALVNALNKLVDKPKESCAKMSLRAIQDAHLSSVDNSSSGPLDYLLTITVDPSGALFESTVRLSNKNYQVLGDISRINHYGNQGDCVDDSSLRKYCYCK